MPGRVRLRDVAEKVGVSTATVSFVLNGKSTSISESTADRVRLAAQELGYRPNALARGLRSQRSRTVGFLSVEVVTTPYAGAMILGAQDVADENDFVLLLGNADDATETERAIGAMMDRQVDAFIYATMYHRVVPFPSGTQPQPVVLLDARTDDDRCSSVVPDEYAGARAAVQHLIDAGHRRIGYVDAAEAPAAAALRRQAYLDALTENGLGTDDAVVAASASSTRSAISPVTALLDLAEPPTALFCFNDRIAAGAYAAARRRNLRLPEDLSIVGFDNQVLIAEAVDPGLTTVQLPHYEMGRWAMERALALLDEDAAPVAKLMPCVLVERGSVAPPK